MTVIRIHNLKLQTIIGINHTEREEEQEVIINVEFEYDDTQAVKNDNIEFAVNYRSITKQIIQFVQNSAFLLLETLADSILELVMREERITRAKVTVDKPFALRFADSVSAEKTAQRTP